MDKNNLPVSKRYPYTFLPFKDIGIFELVAVLLADIDIFLLCEDDQKTLKDKLHNAEEIRNQLMVSRDKLLRFLIQQGYDIEKSIIP